MVNRYFTLLNKKKESRYSKVALFSEMQEFVIYFLIYVIKVFFFKCYPPTSEKP